MFIDLRWALQTFFDAFSFGALALIELEITITDVNSLFYHQGHFQVVTFGLIEFVRNVRFSQKHNIKHDIKSLSPDPWCTDLYKDIFK